MGQAAAMRPRTPLTKPGDSSVESSLASSTASSIATAGAMSSPPPQLVGGQAQQRPVDRRHPVQASSRRRWPRSARRSRPRCSTTPATRVCGVGVAGRVPAAGPIGEHDADRLPTLVGLEQDVEGALACLVSGAHRSGATEVAAVAGVHLDPLPLRDEQRDADLEAGLERRRLACRRWSGRPAVPARCR